MKRGKKTGSEFLWWLEDMAGVRVVTHDSNLLLVTKLLGFLSASPEVGQKGQWKGKAFQ